MVLDLKAQSHGASFSFIHSPVSEGLHTTLNALNAAEEKKHNQYFMF